MKKYQLNKSTFEQLNDRFDRSFLNGELQNRLIICLRNSIFTPSFSPVMLNFAVHSADNDLQLVDMFHLGWKKLRYFVTVNET